MKCFDVLAVILRITYQTAIPPKPPGTLRDWGGWAEWAGRGVWKGSRGLPRVLYFSMMCYNTAHYIYDVMRCDAMRVVHLYTNLATWEVMYIPARRG
jgi:hypothetical protein